MFYYSLLFIIWNNLHSHEDIFVVAFSLVDANKGFYIWIQLYLPIDCVDMFTNKPIFKHLLLLKTI